MLTLAQQYFGSTSLYLTYFVLLASLISSSFLIWTTLLILRQFWVKSLAQTLTIFLLPLITSVLTEVISGDIALSLGMVGALSIVRFRNPVRSPFELTVYFLLITVGIVCKRNETMLLFLIGSFVSLSLLYLFVETISKKYLQRSFFLPSFREGNMLNTLEISCDKEIIIEDQDLTPNSISILDGKYNYIFSSANTNHIKDTYNTHKKNIHVTSISLNLI
tara:strand:+ start:133 stop:792 length:660 start_codon:yes stop_codon:yes gene_type:complete